MIHSAAARGSHLQDRLRRPSKRVTTRLLLAVACLQAICDAHQTATTADFLDALARSQPSLPGSVSDIFPASIQTVTPGIATDRYAQHYDPARSPAAIIQNSAKLTGAVALLDHQELEHLDEKGQDRVLVDLGSASRGLLLLSTGVEVVLEHMAFAGFELNLTQITTMPTQVADGLGGKNDAQAGRANLRDDALASNLVATLISECLMHRASRGTLVLNDVVLALGHCTTAELDTGAESALALLERGIQGDPNTQLRAATGFGKDARGHLATQPQQDEDEAEVDFGESRVDASRHFLRGPGRAATTTSATTITMDRWLEQDVEQKQQSETQADAMQSTAAAPAPESGSRRISHVGPLSGRFLTKGGAVIELRDTFLWCTGDAVAGVDIDVATDINDAFLVDDIAIADAAAAGHRGGARKMGHGRRRLMAAVRSSQVLPAVQPKLIGVKLDMVQGLFLMGVVMVVVSGVWLRRLFSCACFAPSGQAPAAAPDTIRMQNGSRSFHKPSTSLACNSQNHALSALSRFSAQLRKGDDPSVRDGSIRRGSMLFRIGADSSVRGGGGGEGRGGGGRHQPYVPELPALVKELSEVKPAGQGRLAITLQG
ncbi:hypothetical protein Vretifemale_13485, partial [Volvox reticuliferus]